MSDITPNPVGRPSEYSQELADRICAQLSEGISLRTVCNAEDMPDKSTVFRWLRTKPDFQDQYTRAKEESADAHSEDMTDIADDGSNDWMARNDPENPGWVANGEHIQRSRLRIETRKWLASKLKPKKYGDKVSAELSGPGGGPIEVSTLTDAQVEARLAALLSSGIGGAAAKTDNDDEIR